MIRSYEPVDLDFCTGLWFDPGNGSAPAALFRTGKERCTTSEAVREKGGSCALLEKCGFTAAKEASFKKYHMGITFDSFLYEKKR